MSLISEPHIPDCRGQSPTLHRINGLKFLPISDIDIWTTDYPQLFFPWLCPCPCPFSYSCSWKWSLTWTWERHGIAPIIDQFDVRTGLNVKSVKISPDIGVNAKRWMPEVRNRWYLFQYLKCTQVVAEEPAATASRFAVLGRGPQ
jgi:hypothetical protein